LEKDVLFKPNFILKEISMTRTFTILIFTLLSISSSYAWGPTGHRVVGEVAERHLSKKALKRVNLILEGESLAICSNWMDFIKSERSYDSLSAWHYTTIPELDHYHPKDVHKGDVIQAIERFIEEIETQKFSVDEKFALKCLVHLIGDVHQPLHVGNGEDRGGNDLKLTWFGKSTNLHRIWDSDMIESQNLSYTEYANWINITQKDQVSKWQSEPLMVWVEESISYRESMYDIPEKGKLGYRYGYDHIKDVNLRLVQAGIRLAGVLNELYS
jgi:hypothetical protein